MTSKHEDVQLRILDVLIECGGFWSGPSGRVLFSMTQAVFGDDTEIGGPEYKATSLAVLALEQAELVTVERRNKREAEKANIIESIELT